MGGKLHQQPDEGIVFCQPSALMGRRSALARGAVVGAATLLASGQAVDVAHASGEWGKSVSMPEAEWVKGTPSKGRSS